ncbi:proline hydroxylase buaE [Nematostella vectensis]|uniref:proline hydroxylase buaE n=1 Tax=Nematostella vectensis TaxID=45351 RepID=UPI002077947F|nr:proline hydroxylase buaE [Nematostella vectensis]
MESICGIPVVDVGALHVVHQSTLDGGSDEIQELATNIYHGLSTVGFVYLKNHGIPQNQIDTALNVMDEFFTLDQGTKAKYSKTDVMALNGWDRMEAQKLANLDDPKVPGDLRESYDVVHLHGAWPDEHAPQLKPVFQSLFSSLEALSRQVLSVMAIGLGMDQRIFSEFFEHMGELEGGTVIRLNYYPALDQETIIKPSQMRCGAHTDFGAITLLIQDDIGGLEVQTRDGSYVQATPIKGTIIVNIGDLMQRWTSDRLKSNFHRVHVPEEPQRKVARKSVVFFCIPDKKALIKCLDGSDKYPPIKSGEYIADLALKSYGIK